MSEHDLVKARTEVAAARERLLGSVHALQARLKPASLAGNAWDGARARGKALAAKGARVAADRPVATSAAALGIIALIARKPLARLFARLHMSRSQPRSSPEPQPPMRKPRRSTGERP